MEEGKIGFFKRVFLSIKDFESYQRFAIEDTKKAVVYALKLLLLFSAILTIAVLFEISSVYTSIRKVLETDFPEFTYRDSELILEADETIILENETSIPQIVIIDTKKENDASNIERIILYNSGIAILKDRIIVNASRNRNRI